MKNMSLQLNDLQNYIIDYTYKNNKLCNEVLFDFDYDTYLLTCIFKESKTNKIIIKSIDFNYKIDLKEIAIDIVDKAVKSIDNYN